MKFPASGKADRAAPCPNIARGARARGLMGWTLSAVGGVVAPGMPRHYHPARGLSTGPAEPAARGSGDTIPNCLPGGGVYVAGFSHGIRFPECDPTKEALACRAGGDKGFLALAGDRTCPGFDRPRTCREVGFSAERQGPSNPRRIRGLLAAGDESGPQGGRRGDPRRQHVRFGVGATCRPA